MLLRENHPIPLYYQLAELLKEQIENGKLSVGERMPAVKELAEQYRISYMTARQAINELVKEGMLETRKGIGTFVASPKITYDYVRVTGFTEDMRLHGLSTTTHLLALGVEQASERVARELHINVDDPVVRVERLRYHNNVPIVLDSSYLPSRLCPRLEDKELETNSLYAILEDSYGFRLHRAMQWLEATGANRYESELMSVTEGKPMILVRGVTYIDDGRPIEYFKVVYRGDRFKLQFETPRART